MAVPVWNCVCVCVSVYVLDCRSCFMPHCCVHARMLFRIYCTTDLLFVGGVCMHVSEIYTVIHSDLYHQTAFLCNTSIPGRLGLSPCHEGGMCHGDVISIILFLQLSLWTLMSMCDLQVNQSLCKWDWIMMSFCLWGEESAHFSWTQLTNSLDCAIPFIVD